MMWEDSHQRTQFEIITSLLLPVVKTLKSALQFEM